MATALVVEDLESKSVLFFGDISRGCILETGHGPVVGTMILMPCPSRTTEDVLLIRKAVVCPTTAAYGGLNTVVLMTSTDFKTA